MITEIWVPIITTIIGSITTLLVIKYKHKLDKSKLDSSECPIELCIAEDSIILNKLKDVLDDISADRICIFSFHNGGNYYSGKSMQKMSMSYEQTDNGISAVQLDKQNIPVSACLTTIKPTMENGEFYAPDTKEYPEGLCKYHLLRDGVKSAYHWPIIDLHDNTIGFVRIDYVKRKTNITEDDAKKVRILSRQLPGYLTSPQK
jgi:hypothetical protein